MQFTQEQYKAAQKADLVEYLKSQGYRLIKDGRSYRLQEHDSLVVKGNMWYWFSRVFGGTTLQFLTLYEKRSLTEAVNILTNGYAACSGYSGNSNTNNSLNGELCLPERSKTCWRVFTYLNKVRGIDTDIIKDLMMEKKIYESRTYGNCVFVGFDKEGIPRYASMRGTHITEVKKQFRKDIEGSDKSYGFYMNGGSNHVYIFESPIDAMSHATLFKSKGLDWKRDFRLSLGGVSEKALERFLKEHPYIISLSLCLDNDETGQRYSPKYATEYSTKGYKVNMELPGAKDYNEELLMFYKGNKKEVQCYEVEL